ncbi:MAG: hypothetical protein PVI90_19335 [Desulfobacteraceae bacterium]|jgi:hypothetical protein
MAGKSGKTKEETLTTGSDANLAQATQDWGDFGGGQGFDNQTNQDIAIPFLGLLQDLSPQVKKKNDEYIEGAEPGMLFNTVTGQLYQQEAFIVPCYTQHLYVEWVPRENGGGFVGIHELESDVVARAKATAAQFNKLKTDAGNDLVETFYLYALLLEKVDSTSMDCPVVMAFTSTKIGVYKKLMSQLRMVKGKPPMFGFRLRVASKDEMNKAKQPYHNFVITPAVNNNLLESLNAPGTPFQNLLEEGKALMESIKAGTAKAAHESQSSGGGIGEDEQF